MKVSTNKKLSCDGNKTKFVARYGPRAGWTEAENIPLQDTIFRVKNDRNLSQINCASSGKYYKCTSKLVLQKNTR